MALKAGYVGVKRFLLEKMFKDVDEQKADNTVIAPVENGTTASQAYGVGDHFLRDGGYFTVTSPIADGEVITEGTNCVKGKISKRNYVTSISQMAEALPNTYDETVMMVDSNCVAQITNSEIINSTAILVAMRVSSDRIRWYGMFGNSIFAFGIVTNSSYSIHKIVYKDTETAEATNPHEDITLNTTYKYAVKNGKTVNFKIKFTLANDIASGSNVGLFTLPYLPNLQYLNFIIYDATADNYTTQFAFVGNTNGRVYVSKGLTAGGYEISGTYICQ